MGYQEDFQKQSRANRSRSRVQVQFWENSKRSGPHEDKGGQHAKRAIQRRFADAEAEEALREYGDYDE